MNSANKKRVLKGGSLFRIDPETGKPIVLPATWFLPPETSAKNKLSDKKPKTMPRITPLKLTPADFEEPPDRTSKMRKVDHNSVRKGLFNVPAINLSRPSAGRRSLTRRSTAMKKVQPKKNTRSQLSPLLDMEEVEEELLSKNRFLLGYPFKTPEKPCIEFTKDVKCNPLIRKVKLGKEIPSNKAEKTPESTSSNDAEFLELENMCNVNEPNKDKYNQSPVSSVCSLLEGTILHSIKKGKITGSDSSTDMEIVMNDIQSLVERNKSTIEQYKVSYKENLDKISEILEIQGKKYQDFITVQEEFSANVLDKLKCLRPNVPMEEDADKENAPVHSRRSVRLLRKTPLKSNKGKLIVSPAIMKSGDLRKTTLTKNLVTRSQQYQIESPRIRKALDTYNSMRSEISILATPKLDRRGLFESPRSSSLSRILSTTVQNQCLLLQDTPGPKKN